ncbi:MAG TPA: HD-GYP domain-containing protein [Bacillus sp. (in: firmicutes)]|nr:HD-GYP domain-containing protein [Bacillus sp. (in: firmicutes)]
MRLVMLDKSQSGVKLGKSIYNENGRVLLTKGTELTDSLKERLMKLNISTVYIEDEASEGIEIIDSIPMELRSEAANVITEGLNTIANGLNSHTSNIQGMIRTERAVRSFQKIFKDILSCLTGNRTALNLLATAKVHDNYVYTHSLNVTIYACQLAIENGLPLKNIEEIGLGAMLHDVGKMFISPEILNKPGKLTNEEYEHVKSHPELGFEILRKIHEIPLTAAHCALQHHERIDGFGYPRGLKGDKIHRYAKILSVADVFDAVTSHRVYRRGMLPHKAFEILYAGSGTQFESKQIELFKGCIAIYPQGLTVKLNDGRTGIVSNYNFNAVGRPKIRIIRDEDDQGVKPYEIDLSTSGNLTIEIVEADALLY